MAFGSGSNPHKTVRQKSKTIVAHRIIEYYLCIVQDYCTNCKASFSRTLHRNPSTCHHTSFRSILTRSSAAQKAILPSSHLISNNGHVQEPDNRKFIQQLRLENATATRTHASGVRRRIIRSDRSITLRVTFSTLQETGILPARHQQ